MTMFLLGVVVGLIPSAVGLYEITRQDVCPDPEDIAGLDARSADETGQRSAPLFFQRDPLGGVFAWVCHFSPDGSPYSLRTAHFHTKQGCRRFARRMGRKPVFLPFGH